MLKVHFDSGLLLMERAMTNPIKNKETSQDLPVDFREEKAAPIQEKPQVWEGILHPSKY